VIVAPSVIMMATAASYRMALMAIKNRPKKYRTTNREPTCECRYERHGILARTLYQFFL